jgi:hypothetical protein
MALTGHLSDLSLSELIEFFCNQRKTGSLKVLYPHGAGYFFLQTGSVVDAKIGVLRGIDAVYYALTLPNAKFEFSASNEPIERTINQPWTQVVLEGLRRLDEGIEPPVAFPAGFADEPKEEEAFVAPQPVLVQAARASTGPLHMPAFLSFINGPAVSQRKTVLLGAAGVAVLASVVVIGVPAGWYRNKEAAAAPQNATVASTPSPAEVAVEQRAQPAPSQTSHAGEEDQAAAAKRQREKERKREERAAAAAAAGVQASASAPAASTQVTETGKPGSKRVTVTVTYDESGRVVAASGGDATALRIARQKRFPAGKAGSATVTIPIN